MAQKAIRRYLILTLLRKLFSNLKEAGRDLLPIFLVIAAFQLVVLLQPFPQLMEVLTGALLLIARPMLFVQGLEMALFPIGEALAKSLTSLCEVQDDWPGLHSSLRGRGRSFL